MTDQMCPHCGELVPITALSLTDRHKLADGSRCPGSSQNPRCAESDARRLWNGLPNRKFRG